MRYFVNTLPEYTPGIQLQRCHLETSLRRTLEMILSDPSAYRKPSIYTGSGGIAAALWHIAQVPSIEKCTPENFELSKTALDVAVMALKQQRKHPAGPEYALLFGESGTLVIAALCSKLVAERTSSNEERDMLLSEAEKYCSEFRRFLPAALNADEDEFLYGTAGYLFGCLLLNSYFEDSPPISDGILLALAESILKSGKRLAHIIQSDARWGAPLYWVWHDSPYLGAAHGAIGILYVLLNLPERILNNIPHSWDYIDGTVRYILGLEVEENGDRGPGGFYPSRMDPYCQDSKLLVHWCHGSPGAVFLLTIERCISHLDTLPAALRAGEIIWQKGLLHKGPGACHGVSGNAYALLRLYQATGDRKWLYRSYQFASFLSSSEFKTGANVPDHPLSLFEGWAAAACLFADLLREEEDLRCNGGFPLFSL